MVVFYHTAQVHVANFERITKSLYPTVSIYHHVNEAILKEAMSREKITGVLETMFSDDLAMLATKKPTVIICTCSTLGELIDTSFSEQKHIHRIDRPMAQATVQNAKRILIAYTVASTKKATYNLLLKEAKRLGKQPELTTVFCSTAWQHFLTGDHERYYEAILETLLPYEDKVDTIVLAQASMAGVKKRWKACKIPIQTSDFVGVREILKQYSFLE